MIKQTREWQKWNRDSTLLPYNPPQVQYESNMASNIDGRLELDAAKARLTAARKRTESASQLMELTAQTVGLIRLVSNQLVAGIGKTLVDSASKSLEFARSQVVCFQGEMVEAERDLANTKLKWEGAGVNAQIHVQSRSEEPRNYASAQAVPPVAVATRKKRRHVEDNDVHVQKPVNGGKVTCGVRKKSKIEETVHVASTLPFASKISLTSATPSFFSFGAVPAAPPNHSVMASKSFKGATTGSSSASEISSPTDSSPAVGKGKVSAGSNTVDAARATTAILKSRKFLKASRIWQNGKVGKTADGGENSSVFASVKLAPAAATISEKKKGNLSAAPMAPSASAAMPPAPSSSGGKSRDNTQCRKPKERTLKRGSPGDHAQKRATGEETLLLIRAKHFKRVRGEWKKHDSGVLQLYRDNRTSTCYMTIRNDEGQVQFNAQVLKGMLFDKVIKETVKGTSAYVKFVAMEEAGEGAETFLLQVKPETVEELQRVLEGMANNL